jgi:replication-associated recombination protein RarA
MLAEKYRPKSEDEFVGERNRANLRKLEEFVKGNIPVILYGPAGVGKTSAVYLVAEKLGYQVVETNASDQRKKVDMMDLMRRVQMKSFRPVLYLFDEIDGIAEGYEILAKILKVTKHPIVMTANELWKIPPTITEGCEKIRFHSPDLQEVVSRVKAIAEKEGLRVKYDQVTTDIRSSINSVAFGGEAYHTKSNFDLVKKIFAGEKFDEADWDILIWLVDNASRFYQGKKLFEVCQLIALADRTRNFELLRCFEKGRGEAIYPYFLKRLEALRGGDKVGRE